MSRLDRRGALQMAAGFLFAPALLAPPVQAKQSSQPERLFVPEGPMILTRGLQRDFADGHALLVTRKWQVDFRKSAGGIFISGEQLSAEVDAPASLNMLAALERRRIENGRFPIRLDRKGLIIGEQSAEPSLMLQQAVQLAEQKINMADMTVGQSQSAQNMLAQIARTAGRMVGAMAPDFFFPRQLEWNERRELELPGGLRGSVEVHFQASKQSQGHLLHHSNRKIVTRIGDTTRLAKESWSLEPAS